MHRGCPLGYANAKEDVADATYLRRRISQSKILLHWRKVVAERENNGGRGYPFCGIVGNETAKRAILLALTEPLLGGVLLAGERGTGKSTLIRGIPEIEEGKRLWELPLCATRDRLEGSDDWELLLAGGQRRHAPGILEEAAGQLLYVDEINLLPEETEREMCIRDRLRA